METQPSAMPAANSQTASAPAANRQTAVTCLIAAIFALSLSVCIVAAFHIAGAVIGYSAARREYDGLRQYAPADIPAPAPAPSPTPSPAPIQTGFFSAPAKTDSPSAGVPAPENGVQIAAASTPAPTPAPTPTPSLPEINPDYIGWLRVKGTGIDYPVVRGRDNVKYLRTTFNGGRNPSGTVFMDYRCAGGFRSSAAAVYGHNMLDGSMFAPLNRYLDSGYLEGHSEITVVTAEGERLAYRVFAARITYADDAVYGLPGMGGEEAASLLPWLGAPGGGDVLILSTCTDSEDDYERMVVLAERQPAE